MNDVKKIALMISEDPDIMEDIEGLGTEKEVPVIMPWVMVPEWFNEYIKLIPKNDARKMLKAYVSGDSTKKQKVLEMARHFLEPHTSTPQ